MESTDGGRASPDSDHRHDVIKIPTRLKKPLTAVAVGVIVCLVTLGLRHSGLLAIAELKTLDHRYQLYADPAEAGKDIVLVAVDEASLEAYGRWPWPRDRHGYAVQFLKDAGAKAIIFDILFLEPDENAEEFDQSFAEHIRRAGNVFLPTLLDTTAGPVPPPDLLAKATIRVSRESTRAVELTGRYQGVKFPIPPLAEAAQDKETQADALGDVFTARVGYDPTAYLALLNRLRALKGDDKAFFKTHPNFSARIKAVQNLIEAQGLKATGVLVSERFVRLGRRL